MQLHLNEKMNVSYLSYDEQDQSFFEHLRRSEFSRLDEVQHLYFDYTGGNLYPQSLIDQHFLFLKEKTLGNPHSSNPTSCLAHHHVEAARAKVLEYFNAEDYYCVFTQNASSALKIIGECFPFNENSAFLLLSDNHNSVNGIREFCRNKGGKVQYIPVQYEDLCMNDAEINTQLDSYKNCDDKLFAFPAQSNVSGVKHNLDWILKAQQKGYKVLLDAAAFVPSSRLDLKTVQPDFVSISFYKMFGYPTGIGCLLILKSSFLILQKPWFAGGTVTLVSVAEPKRFLAEGHERFEDGTVNYLNIPAIKFGLEFIENIGVESISKHIQHWTMYLINRLEHLKHNNGEKLLKIFGTKDFNKRGGNIILNVFDNKGNRIPFEWIEQKANERNISLRSGCFCNPGIDEINNCLTNEELATYYVSRDKGDYKEMVQFIGKMRGATRISIGYATTKADIDALVLFFESLSE